MSVHKKVSSLTRDTSRAITNAAKMDSQIKNQFMQHVATNVVVENATDENKQNNCFNTCNVYNVVITYMYVNVEARQHLIIDIMNVHSRARYIRYLHPINIEEKIYDMYVALMYLFKNDAVVSHDTINEQEHRIIIGPRREKITIDAIASSDTLFVTQ